MLDNPRTRAWAATIVFAAAFIFLSPLLGDIKRYPFSRDYLLLSLPIYIFLVLLLVHTYHAVRCFTAVVPKGIFLQQVIDVLLVLLYLALPYSLSLNDGPYFFLVATFLFAIASLKYALLIGRTRAEALLRKKLIVDIFGILGCLIAFIGAVSFVIGPFSDWIFTLGFAAATIYLFFINPLYVLPSEPGHDLRHPS